jgi:REP element-mobilizing transposase RayT
VKNHLHPFGSVENDTMRLSENGIIAHEQWTWMKDQYPYIELISFKVMPDHIHGIIYINADFYYMILGNMNNNNVGNMDNNNVGNVDNNNVGNVDNNNVGNVDNNNVGNGRDRSLQSNQLYPLIQTIPKIKPLPELIGAYKTTVSKRIHLHGDDNFKWQKSYYDHIIRNQQSLDRIINYIETNAEKW